MPMRGRLARLVQRNPERPSLRERAAALKISAARVLALKPRPTPAPAATAAASSDPIFDAIAENRRLFDVWTEATKLPLVGIDPAPETDAAQSAFYVHCDNVLLQTVPQTAAGCAALARYAHGFATREGFTLDNQNEDATDHLRILDMIARSPLSALPSGIPTQAAALIALHHVAWSKMYRLSSEQGRLLVSDPRHIAMQPAVDAAFAAEEQAAGVLLRHVAQSPEGVVALASYLPGFMRRDDMSERAILALDAICNSVLALRGEARRIEGRDSRGAWAESASAHTPGFVAYPFDKPVAALDLPYAIRCEASRLLGLAHDEIRRQEAAYQRPPAGKSWDLVESDLRQDLRIDALEMAASPSGSVGRGHQEKPTVPDFRDYSINDLYRTSGALRAADDAVTLAIHALHADSDGGGVLDDLSNHISFMRGYIADELKTRATIGVTEGCQRADVLISWAVACGDYQEAAQFCADQDADERASVSASKVTSARG